jgi:hypothetical protein
MSSRIVTVKIVLLATAQSSTCFATPSRRRVCYFEYSIGLIEESPGPANRIPDLLAQFGRDPKEESGQGSKVHELKLPPGPP